MNFSKTILCGISILLAAPVFADDTIKIGVAGPHSGPYAAFGEQLWRGAVQAAEDINQRGGINGKIIRMKSMRWLDTFAPLQPFQLLKSTMKPTCL